MRNNQLKIGNLTNSTTKFAVQTVFAAYGLLDNVQIMTDRCTGLSCGSALVTFTNDQDADSALEMNGRLLNGSNILVNVLSNKKPESMPATGISGRYLYGTGRSLYNSIGNRKS